MSDRENVISGLRYTVEMFLFDPATGYTKDPDDLNAADRITFDACTGAIDLLKEQEAKPVKIVKNSYDHEFYYCPKCGRGFIDNYYKRPLFCDKCGQAVNWDAAKRR